MPNKNSAQMHILNNTERMHIQLTLYDKLASLDLLNLDEFNIKKLKMIVKLYVEHKIEASGELELSDGRKVIYNLYNDRRKLTSVNITNGQKKNMYKKEENEVPLLIAND